jgi:phosphoribosylpyrophosphate synthetase
MFAFTSPNLYRYTEAGASRIVMLDIHSLQTIGYFGGGLYKLNPVYP